MSLQGNHDRLASIRHYVEDSSKGGEMGNLGRDEKIEWVKHLLDSVRYESLSKADKGTVRLYLQKISGYSRAQVERHISAYRKHIPALRAAIIEAEAAAEIAQPVAAPVMASPDVIAPIVPAQNPYRNDRLNVRGMALPTMLSATVLVLAVLLSRSMPELPANIIASLPNLSQPAPSVMRIDENKDAMVMHKDDTGADVIASEPSFIARAVTSVTSTVQAMWARVDVRRTLRLENIANRPAAPLQDPSIAQNPGSIGMAPSAMDLMRRETKLVVSLSGIGGIPAEGKVVTYKNGKAVWSALPSLTDNQGTGRRPAPRGSGGQPASRGGGGGTPQPAPVTNITNVTNVIGSDFSFDDADDRYVNVAGDTMTGGLAMSGGLIVDGPIAFNSPAFVLGGFTTCTALETDSDGNLICGMDDGGAGSSYVAGQGLTLNVNSFRLSSTITGSLVRFATVSGSTLYAKNLLASSGALALDGTAFFNSASPLKLTDAGFYGCTALETDADGDLVCGSDTDTNTTYTVGQGLAMNGTSISLNSTITGSLLKFTTVSGSTVFARSMLATSGSLVTEGDAIIDAGTFFVDATTNRAGVGTLSPDATFEVIGTMSGSAVTVSTLKNCNTIDTDVNGNMVCGTDGGTTYTAAQGMTLANNAFSVNSVLTGSLVRFLTVSGSTLYAKNTLASSGTLVFEGAASGSSLYIATSLQGAGLTDCDAASSTLAWDASTGRFSCGTDADTDTNTTYTAGAGLALNGTSFSTNSVLTGSLVRFLTISGSTVYAKNLMASSGSLAVDGTAYLNSSTPLRITDGSFADCTALETDSSGNLVCGDDDNSGAAYTAGKGLALNGNTFSTNDTLTGSLLRFLTVSGSTVFGKTLVTSSGTIAAESGAFIDGTTLVVQSGNNRVGIGTASPDSALEVIGTMSGSAVTVSGLKNCDTIDTDANGNLICGTDGGGGATYTAGQGLALNSGVFSVNETLTGSMLRFLTVSGATVYAKNTLASSGTLVFEGAASGSSLYVATAFEGAGLTDCDLASQTLNWDATSKRFSCGTDADTDTTYTAGKGLALNGTAFSTNDTLTGTLLRFLTVSGSTVYAKNLVNTSGTVSGSLVKAKNTLASSGTLVFEGAGSGASLYIATSFQGAGLTDCDASSQTLAWDASTGRFSCGTDDDTNTTYTAGAGLSLNGTTFSTNSTLTGSMLRFLTVSGSLVKAKTTLASSGTLVWEGAASGASLYIATSIEGAGLTDCDAASSTLAWDASTGRFSCGTDADTNTTYTAGQGLTLNGTAFNTNDTLTGTMLRFLTVSGSTVYAKNLVNTSGTISGSLVKAKTTLASSGTLVFEGAASGASLYVATSLEGAGLVDCDLANQTLAWDATSKRFSCGTDADTDTTYTAGKGLTLNGTAFSTNDTQTGTMLRFLTVSGSLVKAKDTLASSGTLVWEGAASGASLYVATSIQGAGLTDCDAATQTLAWDTSTGRFSCGTDSDTTYTAGAGLTLNGTAFSTNATLTGTMLRFLTVSGSLVKAKDTLASSGTLVWEGAASGASLYVATSIQGSGLTDCDAANQTLAWDASTGRFSCGTDADSDTTYTAGAGLTLNGTVFSTNGTLTGTMLRFLTVSGSTVYAKNLVNTSGTISGSLVKAKTTLASSGTLVWEGAASGATLYVATSIEGAGLVDCDLATQTVAWDASTKRFSCGTDSDTTYTAGAGLALNGTAFSTNSTLTGTMLRFLTVSGSLVKAKDTLASSGTLVWEGAASGASLYVATSIQGAGLTDCDAANQTLSWDASTGRFSCGTDADTGTTYTAGQGLTLNGTAFSTNGTLTGTMLRFLTVSGSTVRAKNLLASSGSLAVEGTSYLQGLAILSSGLSSSGMLNIELAEDSQFLRMDDSTNNASVGMYTGTGDPNGVVTANRASLYFASDTGKVWKNNNGGTQWVEMATGSGTTHMAKMTRAAAQSIASSSFTAIAFDTEEFDIGDIANPSTGRFTIKKAGKYLVTASLYLPANATTFVELDIGKNGTTISTSYKQSGSNNTTTELSDVFDLVPGDYIQMFAYQIQGSPLSTATDLNYRPRMSVIQIQDNVGNSMWTLSGSNLYNNNSANIGIGTTTPGSKLSLSGAMIISANGDLGRFAADAGVALEIIGTASGRVLRAQNTLASSGTLVWEGAASGASLYIATSIQGAGLTDCDAAASTLAWDASTGRFSCGTDDGGSFTAGQGLTLNGTAFSTNATLTGTMLRFLTVSGSTVRAKNLLASSGSLAIEGTSYLQGLAILSSGLSSSGALNIELAEDSQFLRLDDSTNGRSIGMYSGSGTPNGVIGAGSGSLYFDNKNARVYAKTAGPGTTQGWTMLSTSTGATALPSRATLWHDESTVTVGNALVKSNTNSNQPYNTLFYQNTSANGDTFTNGFLLRAGTYTFSVFGVTNTDMPKVDWYIDGVLAVSGQDWYSASIAYGITKTATVTITGDGYHVLKGVVNGKNASSSTYNLYLDKMYFAPSADNQNLGVASNGATLNQIYGNDDVNGGARITLTTDDDSIEILNPASNGTDSGALLNITNLKAGKIGLDITSISGVAADAGLRISTNGSNHILFGTGSSTYDTNLYRQAADRLRTDDSFWIGGTLSGSVIKAKDTLASSGTLVWEGAASGASLYVAASIEGAGLTDCDAASSTLAWDATSKRFSCGTDDSGGTYTAGKGLTLTSTSFSTNDTLTGTMIRFLTVSGSLVKAKTTLASSGTLVWEGAGSGASLYVATSIQGAGLTDCDAATQTLAWDTSTGRFSCGTDSDTTYTAGAGLALNGTAFSTNSTLTGTMLRFLTVSGSLVKAKDTLASSGTLAVAGKTTLQGGLQLLAGTAPTVAAGMMYFDSAASEFRCSTDGVSYRSCMAGSGTLAKVQSVARGDFAHPCAVMTNGDVQCWGYNANYVLGIGNVANNGTYNMPQRTPLPSPARSLMGSVGNMYYLLQNGQVYASGDNTYGQLGTANTTTYYVPQRVGTLTGVTMVDTTHGDVHPYGTACAIRYDGQVWCWGYNLYGQTGNGNTTTPQTSPVRAGTLTGVTLISGQGGEYGGFCAIRYDGQVWCWGYNFYGQLGDSSNTDRSTPVRAGTLTNITKLVSTGDSSGGTYCALRSTDSTVWCWGYGLQGQIGDGGGASRNTPTQVTGITTATDISIGGGILSSGFAILSDKTVRAWGYNAYGQLGNGNTTQQNSAVNPGLSNVAQVEVAGTYDATHNTTVSCARFVDGTVKCAGYGARGGVGDGTMTATNSTFTSVAGLQNISRITVASGLDYYQVFCAVSNNGLLKCWGVNDNGQIGNGLTNVVSAVPSQVKALTDGSTSNTFQEIYSNDFDGNNALITLNSGDDSFQITNPLSGGTDSGALVYITNNKPGKIGIQIDSGSGSEFLRLRDTTNSKNVGIFSGSGSPFAKIAASTGSLYLDNNKGFAYLSVAGGDKRAWRMIQLGSSTGSSYPTRATLWQDEVSPSTAQTCDTLNPRYATRCYQSSPADGQYFTTGFFLKGGTYTFSALGQALNSSAKLDWYIDGVLAVSGQDWYAASQTDNVVKTASVTITGDGYHTLRGVINGRNGSNTNNWFWVLSKMWFSPSVDQIRTSPGADYAEWFRTSSADLKAGELVCIDPLDQNTVKRCESEADPNVMGIVSTNPSFIGNDIFGAKDGIIPPGYVLVGLIGQLPAKAIIDPLAESGADVIRPGDSLTPSSRPGYARKAMAGEPTVGVAMQGLASGEGVINVLVARRNGSLTTDAISDRVMQTVKDLRIEEDLKVAMQESMTQLSSSGAFVLPITQEVERQMSALGVNTRIQTTEDRLTALEQHIAALSGATIGSGGSVVMSGSTLSADLVAMTLSLENTLSVGGDARVGGALHVEGQLFAEQLNVSDLFIPGTFAVDGAAVFMGNVTTEGVVTIRNELRLESGAILSAGSGATVSIADLIVPNSLSVLGDITVSGLAQFLGDVSIGGELRLSTRQVGVAVIPESGTSVTIEFSEPLSGEPMVNATPQGRTYGDWWVEKSSATGFTITLEGPAQSPIRFAWTALVTADSSTEESDDEAVIPEPEPEVEAPAPVESDPKTDSGDIITEPGIDEPVIDDGAPDTPPEEIDPAAEEPTEPPTEAPTEEPSDEPTEPVVTPEPEVIEPEPTPEPIPEPAPAPEPAPEAAPNPEA